MGRLRGREVVFMRHIRIVATIATLVVATIALTSPAFAVGSGGGAWRSRRGWHGFHCDPDPTITEHCVGGGGSGGVGDSGYSKGGGGSGYGTNFTATPSQNAPSYSLTTSGGSGGGGNFSSDSLDFSGGGGNHCDVVVEGGFITGGECVGYNYSGSAGSS